MQLISVILVALTAVNQVSSFSPLARHQGTALTSNLVHPASGAKLLAHLDHDEDPIDLRGASHSLPSAKKSTDPKSALELFIPNFLKNVKASQATFLAILMLALSPFPSNAAMSGGRMGGSFSSPRSSVPARSSYSSPSSRGYGGGYGRGAATGFASGYATGLGAGYMSAPRIGFSPFIPPFYARPYYGGAGIITYNPGPSLGQLVFFGGAAVAISLALQRQSLDLPTYEGFDEFASVLGPGTSFAKISVALEVPNRDDPSSILSVLNRLGQTANTESQKGMQSLTSQVALEVLRRKSSIISASTEYQHFKSRSLALREFNNQATKERSKFERENTRLHQAVTHGDSKATMAVVTLVLAIDGDSTKIPRIGNIADVEDALRKIASDSKMDDCLQSVEILWTPEERIETLTLKDVIADYPTLRSV
ncbi:Protein of unknown function (DUF1517) [Fragilaria crotonensis]|nr:Protein of unknown function (DUF1517) [Fragilaria crotonensis]